MKLETLLKIFAASDASELKIEPDAKPYLISDAGKTDVADTLLTSALVSQLIFPVIPLEEKLRLSSLPQISFRSTNELGLFSVTVAKSPAGLNASIKKISVPKIELEAGLKPSSIPAVEPPAGIGQVSQQNLTAPYIASPQTLVNGVLPNGNKSILTPANVLKTHETESDAEPSNSLGGAELPQLLETDSIEFEETIDVEDDLDSPATLQNVTETSDSATQTLANVNNLKNLNSGYGNGSANYSNDLPPKQKTVSPKMDALFYKLAELKASDLHLCVSMPPMMRMDGKMAPLGDNQEPIAPAAMQELLYSIMPEKNREEFERRHDTDFAYEIKGLARFRANIFMDRKGMGGVFRIIPSQILTAEKLGLSKAILELCSLNKGLVVVTGPTGSGKSTTLCAMIDHVNRNREDHIITIEDPIEFVHENQKCLLNQREVHNHTDSFKDALRAALREDPDILLVGEMRDLETISIAIETAETGHLVFGTLHTTTAPSTVDRIIDQFPADRQQQIRVMLSESLKGVIAQTLLPKIGGGRIAALEVLIITPAISNLIREGKTFQIASAMQTGKQHGMTTLNDSLVELVVKGLVEPRQAYLKAIDKPGIEALFKRNEISVAKFKEIFD